MIRGAAGQKIGAELISATDGSAFSGTVTVYVTGDAGVQAIGSVGSGLCTNEGNGYYTYTPSAAETNYTLVAFTFVGSGAVNATVQLYPDENRLIRGAAGQKVGAELISATDGSAFSGTVTVYITGDAGVQAIGSVGSGLCTNEGNGYYTYAPSAAETNYALIAFTFVGSGAVNATVQLYTAASPSTRTARTLITRALILTGAISEGDPLPSSMYDTALGVLQDIINAWAADRLMIYVQGRSEQSLTANKADYTLGLGGDWNIARPMFVDRMTILDPTVTPRFEFPPMHLFTDDEWASLRIKGITSAIPTGAYINQTYPLATVSLYMVPDNSTYKAVLYYPQATDSTVATLDTVLSYPPGYDRALRYSLAFELSLIPGTPAATAWRSAIAGRAVPTGHPEPQRHTDHAPQRLCGVGEWWRLQLAHRREFMRVPFLGGSSHAQSPNVSVERTMNWYPAGLSAANPKLPRQQVLYPTPGMSAWATVDAAPIRGEFSQDGRMFVVGGGNLYELNTSGVPTLRGSGMNNDGYGVTIHSNGDAGGQLFIVGGGEAWIYSLTANTLTRGSFDAVAMGGFAILQTPDTPVGTPSQLAGSDLAAGDYKIAVTAVDALGGETLPSSTVTVTVAAGGLGQIVVTYVAPAGWHHFHIYCSDTNAAAPDRFYVSSSDSTFTITSLSSYSYLGSVPTVATTLSFHVLGIQNALWSPSDFTFAVVGVDATGGLTLPTPMQTISRRHNGDDMGTVTVSYTAPAGAASTRVYISAAGGGTPDRYFAAASTSTCIITTLATATLGALPSVANAYLYTGYLGFDYGGFVDGYFLGLDASLSTFYQSDLENGLLWDPADAYQRNTASDRWLSMLIVRGQIWIFGSQTTDIWYNDGTQFVPISGALIQYGIAAVRSAAVVDNAPMWLSQSKDGVALVLRGNGYQPQRVSTDELEWKIQHYTTISDAVGWTYQESGHTFYLLSFPTQGVTWVFDAATNLWHERGWWDVAVGEYTAYRPQSHVYAFGKHLVGDRTTGTIYEMRDDLPTDVEGAAILRMRQGQHICNEQNWHYVSRVQVDCETGVGTVACPNPTLTLAWSDDGGHTWTADHPATIGPQGAYKQRAVWRNLGRTRDRCYRLTGSDPVPYRVLDFYSEDSQGALQ